MVTQPHADPAPPATYEARPDRWYRLRGRIRRARYWQFYQILILVGMMLALVFATWTDAVRGSFSSVLLAAALLVMAGLSWLTIACAVKRLHDHDWSGWWVLPMQAVAFADLVVAWLNGPAGVIAVLAVASKVGLLLQFVVLGCLKGTARPNRYGPDPVLAAQADPYILSSSDAMQRDLGLRP